MQGRVSHFLVQTLKLFLLEIVLRMKRRFSKFQIPFSLSKAIIEKKMITLS